MTEIVVFGTSRPSSSEYVDWHNLFSTLQPGPDFSEDNLTQYVISYLEEHNLDPNEYDIKFTTMPYNYGSSPTSFKLSVTPKPKLPSFSAEFNYAARKPRREDGTLDQ